MNCANGVIFFHEIYNFINQLFANRVFTDPLELADIPAFHKKEDQLDKDN